MGRICIFFLLFCFVITSAHAQQTKDEIEGLFKQANITIIKLLRAGKYKNALKLAKQAKLESERTFGSNHPLRIASASSLGMVYHTIGKYDLAEPLLKSSLEMRERVLGKEHPDTVTSVHNLAGLYQDQGRYAQAEHLLKRAVEVSRRILGDEHTDTLISMNNLAELYRAQGRYALAEALYKNTLEIRDRVSGRNHPQTLTVVNNLGGLYLYQSRFGLAEKLFKRALEGSKRINGTEHPSTVKIINNLALVYKNQERFALAEPLLKRAVAAYRRVYGDKHPETLNGVQNLAAVYMEQGKFALAEPLFKDVLNVQKRILGVWHPATLGTLSNLANLYQLQGHYRLAKVLHMSALKGFERAHGKEHPQTINSINSLAALHGFTGQSKQAIALFKRALKIQEKTLGKGHPDTLLSINNLAFLYYRSKKWRQATDLLDRGTFGLAEHAALTGKQTLSSQSKLPLQRENIVFLTYLKAAYQVAKRNKRKHSSLSRKTFTRLQWLQGAGASAALSQMALRSRTGDEGLARLVRERQDMVQRWRKLDNLLSQIIGLPQKQRNTKQEKDIRSELRQVRKRIRQIDAIFKNKFPDYATLSNPVPLKVKEVQAQLQHDEALVFIIDTPKVYAAKGETFVWVVTKNKMKWVRSTLGTKALTTIVKSLRCGLDGGGWNDKAKAKECNKLLKLNYRAADYWNGEPLPFRTQLAYMLYKGLFGQIQNEIKGKKLLLVPSGPLTSLPFQVLLTGNPRSGLSYSQMKWLIREHEITVLPSVASIKALRRNAGRSKARKAFLGIGNPLLVGPSGNDKSAWAKQSCKVRKTSKQTKLAAKASPDGVLKIVRGGVVNLAALRKQPPLPEAADELCRVAEVLNTGSRSVLLGAEATEANIKSMSGSGALKNARILHFATHGLLAGETKQLAKNKAEPSLLLTPPSKPTTLDDGLLTASEISQLKLDADWVILSACNTAAAEKPGAEALSGLAKSFFYAGARALLVSHWYVESDAAVQLIAKSIEAIEKKQSLGRAGALRLAMLDLIKSSQLSHPGTWAPFVVVGEGR